MWVAGASIVRTTDAVASLITHVWRWSSTCASVWGDLPSGRTQASKKSKHAVALEKLKVKVVPVRYVEYVQYPVHTVHTVLIQPYCTVSTTEHTELRTVPYIQYCTVLYGVAHSDQGWSGGWGDGLKGQLPIR